MEQSEHKGEYYPQIQQIKNHLDLRKLLENADSKPTSRIQSFVENYRERERDINAQGKAKLKDKKNKEEGGSDIEDDIDDDDDSLVKDAPISQSEDSREKKKKRE